MQATVYSYQEFWIISLIVLIYQGRGGEELSLELSRALQRSLLGGQSGVGEHLCSLLILINLRCHLMHTNLYINDLAGAAINLSALSIFDGKLCWNLYIDGLILSSQGNLLDALAIAVKVYNNALKTLISTVLSCSCACVNLH